MIQTPELKGEWMVTDCSGEEANEVVERGADVVVGVGEVRDGPEKTARKYRCLGKLPAR